MNIQNLAVINLEPMEFDYTPVDHSLISGLIVEAYHIAFMLMHQTTCTVLVNKKFTSDNC